MRNRVEVRKGLVGVLAATVLASAPSAWAGHPQERHGFWIGFGAGYGSASVSADCEDCSGDERQDGVSAFLKLGGTLNQHVLLGVESNGWTKEEEGTRVTLGAFTGTVTFYPQAEGGFFLKAGAGASYLRSEFSEGSFTASFDKVGWAVLVGAGYDFRVGRNISLTPCINYHYGKPGDIDIEGEVLPGFKQNVVSFELGITFH